MLHEHHHHHEHHHGHHHQHAHSVSMDTINKAFIIGIGLNVIFVLIEFVSAFAADSMGLLSDAGHNLSDVASLLLALLAFKLNKVGKSNKYTYGYKKSTILVSLLNAIILLGAVAFIVLESIEKFQQPQPAQGGVIAIVAGIGVFINAFTAWLFIKDKDKDLNVKGAYLHMAMDALVSVGVVISGIAIKFTGLTIIDPIIGLVIAAVIVFSTWSLLRDSLLLALDGVPNNVCSHEVTQTILSVDGVCEMHHLHIWALSTTENALTAHVVIPDFSELETIKKKIKQDLKALNISHATLEFEDKNTPCCDK